MCPAGQEPRALFLQSMAYFELWLLQHQLQQLSPATATPNTLSDLMVMLDSATKKAAALAMDGHNTATFEAMCKAALQRMKAAAAGRAQQAAAQHQLDAEKIAVSSSSWQLPAGVLPAAPGVPEGQAAGLQAAKDAAAAALGSLPVGPWPAGVPLAQQLQLLLQQHPALSPKTSGSDAAALLALCSVENVLFTHAAAGLEQPGSKLESVKEVQQLEQLVDAYRATLHSFKQTPAAAACMQVGLRSREVLVVWTAYCITFEAARSQLPVVEQYGVGLQWRDLDVLVLSDRAAVDAARGVAAYLFQHNVPGRQLFSLADEGRATFSMACEFAAQCPHLMKIWKHEVQQAEQREDKRWVVVQQKQKLAAQLRQCQASLQKEIKDMLPEMTLLQSQLGDVQSQLDSVNSTLWGLPSRRFSERRKELSTQKSSLQHQKDTIQSQLSPLQSKKQALESDLHSVESKLAAEEKAPPPILQPLPKDSRRAWQWLFFLHMPPLLRCLGRCSFLVQQLLLPLPCTREVATAIQVDGMATSLVAHYNSHQQCKPYHTVARPYTGSDGCVQLQSAGKVPKPDNVGPKHVDAIASKQQGVWYPDDLAPAMAWSSTGTAADKALGFPSGFFNPFRSVSRQLLAENFTECIQPSNLQWAMLQLGSRQATPAVQGNLGIACQDLKPAWLSKPGYLAFTSLRSYPLGQLQRLCVALREQSMPMGHPAVVTLVKQAVYQIGELVQAAGSSNSSSADCMELLWRSDWGQESGTLAALCFELQQLAEKLQEAPREHDAVLLLGQLAAYLSDWNPSCKAIARQFADMTSRAAEQLQSLVEEAAQQNQEEAAMQLQAKQCKARALSLLCYGAGPLAAADVGHMLQLMVLVKHGDLFLSEAAVGKDTAAELQRLRVQCRQVMARRLPAVLAMLLQQQQLQVRGPLLTAAVPECYSGPLQSSAGSNWAYQAAAVAAARRLAASRQRARMAICTP